MEMLTELLSKFDSTEAAKDFLDAIQGIENYMPAPSKDRDFIIDELIGHLQTLKKSK